MHIKFLPHGTGVGQDAIAYLLGEEDHKGEIRASVEVWRGNPKLTGKIIDSLKTVYRYTSGVINFAPEDQPTDNEIGSVLDEFERVSFAGLEKNQYDFCAVVHRESNGGVHVHVIVPRIELTKGKAMNIAPPGWQLTYDPLRDAFNHDKGWARPDDPSRARLVQQGKAKPQWRAGVDHKIVVTNYLTELVAAGLVSDRRGVLDALAEIGEVTRAGKDYVSVKLEGSAKAIRLKGVLYGDDFSRSALETLARQAASRPESRGRSDPDAAAAARQALERAIQRRADYNTERYRAPQPGTGSDAPNDLEAPALADALASPGQPLPGANAGDRIERLELVDGQASRAESGELRADAATPDAGFLQQSSRAAPVQQYEKVIYGRIFKPGFERLAAWPSHKPAAGIGGLPKLSSITLDAQWPGASKLLPSVARDDLERQRGLGAGTVRRAGGSDRPNTEGESINDRARKIADDAIAKAKQAASAAARAIGDCAAATSRAIAAVGAACSRVDRAMPALKNGQADELERFKREINLVEFAQSLGYEIIKKESSKASTVMRSGGDKIIVATDKADDHGIYFSVGDDGDNGTLIDFAQTRLRLNLGLLRKELRGWLPAAARPSPKRKAVQDRPQRPQPVEKDRAQLAVQWARMKPYSGSYLTQERRISEATIEAFGVRQDERGNAVFRHRDSTGTVCGWEVKNDRFTGFSAGGEKSVMSAKLDGEPLSRIVLFEAAIDAMSYAQMHHEAGSMYVSLGGEMKPDQLARLKAVQAANPESVTVLAFDNDLAGDAMAHQVQQNSPQGVQTVREVPDVGKDWNDALKARWVMPKAI